MTCELCITYELWVTCELWVICKLPITFELWVTCDISETCALPDLVLYCDSGCLGLVLSGFLQFGGEIHKVLEITAVNHTDHRVMQTHQPLCNTIKSYLNHITINDYFLNFMPFTSSSSLQVYHWWKPLFLITKG